MEEEEEGQEGRLLAGDDTQPAHDAVDPSAEEPETDAVAPDA